MRFIIPILLLIGCGSVLRIKSGSEAFKYKKYALAIDMLQEELSHVDNVENRVLLARSLDNIGRYQESEKEYMKIIQEIDDSNIMLEYAAVLKKRGRYQDAILVFNMLKTESQLDALLDRELRMCKSSMNWINNPDTLLSIYNLSFNSIASDYSPAIFDGNIIYSSDQVDERKAEVYDWTGLGFSRFWVAEKDAESARIWDVDLNTKLHEGNAFLHKNGNEIYFTRCADEGNSDVFCHIYKSQNQNGKWTKGEVVENVNGAYNSRHPVINAKGDLMFFTSDRQDAFGGFDLYYSKLTESGWSIASPLSRMINTEDDEGFPSLRGDTLYFASKGLPGMGGYDLFYSFFGDNDQWVKPVNLLSPINSGADDFSIVFDTVFNPLKIEWKGYFTSNREGGKGRDDIYGFERAHLSSKPIQEIKPWVLTVKILEPVYIDLNDPNSGIQKYSPLGNVTISSDKYSKVTDITGLYTTEVDSNDIIVLDVFKKGFLRSQKRIDIRKDAENQIVFIRIVMNPIHYGTEIVIDQIYYDFNKWNIREDAKPGLDTLYQILVMNPDLKIRLASHTDCRGEDDFNLELSQKRADSVVEYLLDKGIEKDRLQSIGRGETMPSDPCLCQHCQESEHQKNRRTTFEVLK